ncbi:MAG: hypothetical protein HYV07_24620 [Deltaproteobacteria bacterium]|nr:hypothetical protein [Deltaproteobacteria bacterium]
MIERSRPVRAWISFETTSALLLLTAASTPRDAFAQPSAVEGVTLFEDDFRDNRSGWALPDNPSERVLIDGSMLIERRVAGQLSTVEMRPSGLREGDDFTIEGRLRRLSGGADGFGTGLVFGAGSPTERFDFLISATGFFSVMKLSGGAAIPLVAWRESAEVRRDPGQVNELTIKKRGAELAFAINGFEVARVAYPGLLGSLVGFVVSSQQAARAERLRVARIEPLPPQTIAQPTQPKIEEPQKVPVIPEKRRAVAVLDMQDPSGKVSKETLTQLADLLGTLLAQGGAYSAIPRERLQAQLGQQKADSYKSCYDTSCQIELGRAVAAEAIVTSKVLRVGGECMMTAEIYDLKTELSIKAATAEAGCTDKELLKGVKMIASKL